ncbi:lyase family protein [Actinokineospora sp. NBRC 105648]|uniref:argininosuccinate lyase n=1 Tax=Actinokineospora sp. NBRC 105648 TaxID=3032206 RepID=UPI00249FCFB3|nr:lyase family protein [Actinokineospora sp. NBRC 105648]GLZ39377.1 argininosuccinate lyase [Actinokineospora sp. NBRC 105648]
MTVEALTGRIAAGPSALLRAEVLLPQLRFELDNLLPHYLAIERVLLLEYQRMGVLTDDEVARIGTALSTVDRGVVEAAAEGMADIAFGVERAVTAELGEVPPAWHVDRSRNDLQATAQKMYGRARVFELVAELADLVRAAHRLAERERGVVMPGYTHSQPAQVMTADFYFTALAEQLLHALDRFTALLRVFDECPMGAGAMTGGDLGWDRDRMAELLGFASGSGNALRAVAARDWTLEATAELCLLGVPLSRFATDLITWAGAGYGFLDLPDELSGISSAMPQKKNFPVLERIRARTARLAGAFTEVVVAQRATPFSNTVEVSKEASSGVPAAFDDAGSVLRLLRVVLDNLVLRADRLRAVCETEYLGGFGLANGLCLAAGVPWRQAQVVAGRYVVAALERGLTPGEPDGRLLEEIARASGHRVADGHALLVEAFDVDRAVAAKRTAGSTGPEHVAAVLDAQRSALARAEAEWARRRADVEDGGRVVERLLAGAGEWRGSR